MGTLGPNSSGTIVDDATIGTISITNVTNAAASDNLYATIVMLLSQVGHYIKATNFGFAIPTDATITGVTVEVEKSSTALAALEDNSIKLVKTGAITGNEKAVAGAWPTSDAYSTYGSSSDLWGLALTPADINASTFGVAVSAKASLLAGTAQIDHIRITVDYTGSNKPGNAYRRVSVGDGMGRSESAT